ncbi:hypothetical protein EHN07_05440 [Buttiauxella warmboldiae]|uniref:TolC family protein n=1 Tax=Buttiauxella warmboldiae TaxID=82993 RepID=A0A3N5DM00_9ENTR|nr:TolC family protein [Buttiauxella warmboldiae]RPH29645.1 hypothetical protein EHN07_05440 [Buttiauxella warmboldiae]
MKKIINAIYIISALFTSSAFSGELSYQKFIDAAHQSALSIIIKETEFEAEAQRSNAIQYYYVPKIIINSEKVLSGSKEKELKPNVGVNANIYNSAQKYKISEHDNNLLYLRNAVDIEKRDVTVIMMKNLIGIRLFSKLHSRILELEKAEKLMTEDIKMQNDSGLIGDSILKQSQLLSKKIGNEIENVNQQLDIFETNIKSVTLKPFPVEGVDLPYSLIDKLIYIKLNGWDVGRNLDLIGLKLQAAMLRDNADQQNSLVNVDFVFENKIHNRNSISMKDKYVGLNMSLNLFDLNKISDKKSRIKTYEAARLKIDAKQAELINDINKLNYEYNSSINELKGLTEQMELTKGILNDFDNEYRIGKVSFYEILNTKYDLVNIERKISNVKLKVIDNRLNVMKVLNLSFNI